MQNSPQEHDEPQKGLNLRKVRFSFTISYRMSCLVTDGSFAVADPLTWSTLAAPLRDTKARFPLPELTARVNGPS